MARPSLTLWRERGHITPSSKVVSDRDAPRLKEIRFVTMSQKMVKVIILNHKMTNITLFLLIWLTGASYTLSLVPLHCFWLLKNKVYDYQSNKFNFSWCLIYKNFLMPSIGIKLSNKSQILRRSWATFYVITPWLCVLYGHSYYNSLHLSFWFQASSCGSLARGHWKENMI